jgi:hypothetical protein
LNKRKSHTQKQLTESLDTDFLGRGGVACRFLAIFLSLEAADAAPFSGVLVITEDDGFFFFLTAGASGSPSSSNSSTEREKKRWMFEQ